MGGAEGFNGNGGGGWGIGSAEMAIELGKAVYRNKPTIKDTKYFID
jgi:hypothetical protein